jgi:carbonic anhydrase/acetyltransferase-like protein (isoleucine patch superfamily)
VAIYNSATTPPRIAPRAWVADSASVIGRVALAEGASVWYGAVLRGDNDLDHHRRAQQRAGRQRAAHRPRHPAGLGEDVTVGHQVMLHGCTIGDGSLIGIQSRGAQRREASAATAWSAPARWSPKARSSPTAR